MRESFALACLLLGGALAVTGCSQSPCTDAACTSGISVKVVGLLPTSPALVRTCLDQSCTVVPWPMGSSSCEEVDARWHLSVCLQDDGSFITLAFGDEARARDGMKFELVFEDAEGEALLHESETVTFSDSYPNGKRCPGHCKYANFRY